MCREARCTGTDGTPGGALRPCLSAGPATPMDGMAAGRPPSPGFTGASMQRTFLYFAAFTGMGAVFAATLIVAALILGQGPATSTVASATPRPGASAPIAEG